MNEENITVTGSLMPTVPGTLPAPPLECGLQLVEGDLPPLPEIETVSREEAQARIDQWLANRSSMGAFPEDSKFYYPRSM